MINYKTISTLIAEELTSIINSDEEFYKEFRFLIADEQMFSKDNSMESGTIYIVIKYLEATLNFNQTILPATINVISEKNGIEVCRKLLLDFAQLYNLGYSSDMTIRQFYNSPQVISVFDEVGDGFRATLSQACSFLISDNLNGFKTIEYIKEGKNYELPVISGTVSYSAQVDSEAFYATKSNNRSVGQIGVLVANLVLQLQNIDFINEILKITFNKSDSTGVDTTFSMKFTYNNGFTSNIIPMKLIEATQNQTIGDMPVITVSLSR